MSKRSYRVFLISICFILFSFSIFLGYKYIDKKEENNDDIISKNNIDIYEYVIDKPVMNNSIKDINVECKVKYLLCNEVVTESINVISASKDEIKKRYIDYNILEETSDSIKFIKNVNTYCPNHFLLKILNDYVVIYRYITNDEIEIYKSTEIHKNELREEIINDFNKGMRVDSLEELNTIIEEIES